MLLKNKLAIVTGSNRGIGKEVLRVFAENGADLFACARRETPEFSALCESLADQHRVSIQPIYFDLESSDEIKTAVNAIVSSRRRIDILVNNAGIASGGLLQMTSMQEMRRVFEINFFSQLQLTQTLSRLMARQKSGAIVNIASTAGLRGDAGMTAYGGSKAALMLATKTLASELGEAGVRVNAIAPSVTKTDMYDQMEQKALERLIQASALKRPADPREIANVALFLASDLSSYMTGQVLQVDGGAV